MRLIDSSMLSLRAYITDLIYNGATPGDEIYQCLYELTGSENLTSDVEAKAEDLMDALSGWCSPDYYLGEGNYGQHVTA